MTIRLVTRAGWGARAPKSAPSTIRPVGSVIHWNGPRMGTFDHAQCAGKVRSTQSFHMDSRGWADIAYSAAVCQHGYVFEGRGKWNRTAANGTNAANNEWHAIEYMGGEGDPFTEPGRQGILDAHDWLGGGSFSVHSDHYSTACPGDVIRSWVKTGQKVVMRIPMPTSPSLPPLGPEILLVSLGHALTLDVPNGRQVNGARPGLWTVNAIPAAQRFRQSSRDARGDQGIFCSTSPNLALDVDVASSKVQLWEWNGNSNQLWNFIPGQLLGTWGIRNEYTGLYLAATASGAMVVPQVGFWATVLTG